MTTDSIRFTDGARYERYMGEWSQLVGDRFLTWLAPERNRQWLDVGCGNGAFTEMIVGRCHPASVEGLDPSEEQLAYARLRPALHELQFRPGDAMALPYADGTFDVAVMPLVIFFVPEPARGVSEMARVVRPGGAVAAYAWDMPGGGFPYESLLSAIRGLGIKVPAPPSPEASRIDVMQALWAAAGLEAIETQEIVVQRSFPSFEAYWEIALGAPSVGPTLASLATEDLGRLRSRVRAGLPEDASGRITYGARANAVKGRVPRAAA